MRSLADILSKPFRRRMLLPAMNKQITVNIIFVFFILFIISCKNDDQSAPYQQEAKCLEQYGFCDSIYVWDHGQIISSNNLLYVRWQIRSEKYQESLLRTQQMLDQQSNLDYSSYNYREVQFYHCLSLYETDVLSLVKINKLLEVPEFHKTKHEVDLLFLKANILRLTSRPDYALATAYHAEHLASKLSTRQQKQLYYPRWYVLAITLIHERKANKKQISFFLKRGIDNISPSPKRKWLRTLLSTTNNNLNKYESDKFLLEYVKANEFAPKIHRMIKTEIASFVDNKLEAIVQLEKNIRDSKKKCTYDHLYLIDEFLAIDSLVKAKTIMNDLSYCKSTNRNIYNTLYFYRLQRYFMKHYESNHTINSLKGAYETTDSIMVSYDSYSKGILNQHYADAIHMANSILIESLFNFQKIDRPIQQNKIIAHLTKTKNLYSKILDSRSFLKGYALNDQSLGIISKIQYRIAQNELATNYYQDTTLEDMSIYEDLYNDYSLLHSEMKKVESEESPFNSIIPESADHHISRSDQIIDFVETDSAYYLFDLRENATKITKLDINVVSAAAKNITNHLQQKATLTPYTMDLLTTIQNQISTQTSTLYIVPDGLFFDIPTELYTTNHPSLTVAQISNSGDYFELERETLYPSIATFSYSNIKTIEDRSPRTIPEQPQGYYESQEINTNYISSKLISGSQFTIANIFNEYQTPILHFSSHASSSQINQLNNYIYTRESNESTPNPAYGFHLKTKKLNNNLVILSACNSGTGVQLPGTGVFSLSRDFLQAGAQTVIKSLWAVNETSTKELMVEMHRNFTNGQSIGEALANAKKTVKSMPEYAHSYYWAGFVLEGNPHVYLEQPDNSNN